MVDDGGLAHGALIFNFPRVPLPVVDELGRVVAFVQVLEHGRQDFGRLVRQVNPSSSRLEELRLEHRLEVCRSVQYLFMASKQSLVGADADGDDSRGQCATHGLVEILAVSDTRMLPGTIGGTVFPPGRPD